MNNLFFSSMNNGQKESINDLKLNILSFKQKAVGSSDLYQPISSIERLKPFIEAGFTYSLEDMRIKGSRKVGEEKYAVAHLVKLSHPDLQFDGVDMNEAQPVIFFWNSANRSKSFQIDFGLFRSFCWNSMVFGEKLAPTMKLIHKAADRDNFDQRIETMINKSITFAEELGESIRRLQDTILNEDQARKFARTAFELRAGGSKIHKIPEESIDAVLANLSGINEDNGNTMWQVLNRVQRNLGLNYGKNSEKADSVSELINYEIITKDREDNTVIRSRKLSRIYDPSKVVTLNKNLFDESVNLVEQLAA